MHSKRCHFDVVPVIPDLTSNIVNVASPSSKGSQLYKGLRKTGKHVCNSNNRDYKTKCVSLVCKTKFIFIQLLK